MPERILDFESSIGLFRERDFPICKANFGETASSRPDTLLVVKMLRLDGVRLIRDGTCGTYHQECKNWMGAI